MSEAEARREFTLGNGSPCRAVGLVHVHVVRADTTIPPDSSSLQRLNTRPFLPLPSRPAYCLLVAQTSCREQASKHMISK